eukprot:1493192-Rhodomonas_salina.1
MIANKNKQLNLQDLNDMLRELGQSILTLRENGHTHKHFANEVLSFIVAILSLGENGILRGMDDLVKNSVLQRSVTMKNTLSKKQCLKNCDAHLDFMRNSFAGFKNVMLSQANVNTEDRKQILRNVCHVIEQGINWVGTHGDIIVPGTS